MANAYPGVTDLKVAVMGCVVNGPGESKHANIGISLPGTFEDPKAPVYVDGKLMVTLKGDNIVPEFLQILDDYVERRYAVAADGSSRSSRVASTVGHLNSATIGCIKSNFPQAVQHIAVPLHRPGVPTAKPRPDGFGI